MNHRWASGFRVLQNVPVITCSGMKQFVALLFCVDAKIMELLSKHEVMQLIFRFTPKSRMNKHQKAIRLQQVHAFLHKDGPQRFAPLLSIGRGLIWRIAKYNIKLFHSPFLHWVQVQITSLMQIQSIDVVWVKQLTTDFNIQFGQFAHVQHFL